ncbi:hypothetical protein CKQ84_17795 [Shewanella sp. WE21]|jgi:hypothetical protein|uniref:three component ABC system middle component n=1 Tax=Shewanella sp. WE21 TaxID=2029986 RepID=UPI000CF68BED|nr:three component ABC system middle component [Shewanella sp. WE21]AVI67563.1 hypothetical protein CKQ84_17795 [Shewanella sp. WE21]
MTNYYNNIGIGVVALGSVISHSSELNISKVFLIFPFISHQNLLQHLGRKSTKISSIEKLIAEKIGFFSNFNSRYLSSLVLTINSLQYLNDTGYIRIDNGIVILIKPFEYKPSMGARAKKIFSAAENVSHILDINVDKLYLNLRVEI